MINPKTAHRIASSLLRRPEIAGDVAGSLMRRRFADAARRARAAARRPDVFAEKVISRKYNYLWLCNPKVASRSIIAALLAADPGAEVIRDASVSRVLQTHPEAREYSTFAFVRHPAARAYSFHRELRSAHLTYEGEQRLGKERKRDILFRMCCGLEEADSFEAYCEWLHTPYGSDAFADRHFLSQSAHLRLPDGRLPDFVGRLESLDADFRAVAESLRMPTAPMPLLNSMAGWEARREDVESARAGMDACLTPRVEELLRTRYAEDYELGGYAADGGAAAETAGRNGVPPRCDVFH